MVLVTGGTGLVGSHLLLNLAMSNTEVRAIYRTPSKLDAVKKVFSYYVDNPTDYFNKIDWVQGDILDIPSLEKAFSAIDYVYHTAALISFEPNDFTALEKTNVEGTANIVNLCIDFKVKKLCYVSTIGAIGRSINGNKATENNEWNSQHTNVYALTKQAAEMEIWRGSQENLPVVIINPGVIFGPGFWETGSGRFFTTAQKGYAYYPPGGTGFIAIGDVIKIMRGLMASSTKGERFIAIAKNKSYANILEKIGENMGRKPPHKKLAFWQLKIGVYMELLKHVLLGKKRTITKNTIYSLKHPEEYNNSKIKEALDFEFEPLEKEIKFCCEKFILERQSLVYQ
ncbi:NAD-dependent epimerase/dehydratase family protein [Maribacter sp. CXY002]|uniref:NAD-dependent epimerase/dehydratase family protein n=1 Tax=Maribacter luteocoastalis TaxID=3407671 RepID=UPI003B670222